IWLAKGVGRLADRKSQNTIVIEQGFASLWSLVGCLLIVVGESCSFRYGRRIMGYGLAPNRLKFSPRHALELQRHVGHFNDGPALGIHDRIGNGIRFRPEADLFDRHLISGDSRRLNDLTPALEPAGDTWNWLPGNVLLLADPAHTHEINSQRMQTALVHQRARHDSIINEMAGQ